ncbi:transglycosylase SLT domain-containing protein [Clostridium sp.]|uniref:transglycosylase SLT domain-containing protein n=1 Tax=Clostridium sp. TaxID=1506 RepID=UPI003993E2EF
MLGELIILDSDKKICARLTPSLYFDYSYHAYLETGAETFDFSVTLDEELEQVITERNFVLFIRNNKYKMFQIMACEDEENIDSVVRNVQSEIVGLELRNDYIRESTITGNMNKFLDTILKDTNYKKGYVSSELDDISVETSITEPKAVYTVIQESIARYGNCEYEFTVNPIDSINGNYELIVNCYADGERGNKTYKRYDYDFNSYGMKRTGDATDLASGLIGVGANGITFKDIKWEKDQGDPLDKPLGQDFLLDPDAHDMFSNGDKYILGKYTSDTTDPGALLLETYKKLQEVKQIKYSYEIPVYLTDDEYDEIEVGDTNYIVNDKFNPPIQLEGRISELELTDSENKITLANFKNVKSNIKSLKKEDIINETIDIIKKTGKLTTSDILAIRQYLQQLGVDKKNIDSLIKKYTDKVVPDPVKPGDDTSKISEDTEDYRAINIKKIDNGLWIGDSRIHDCIKYKCGEIKGKTPTTQPQPDKKEDSSKTAKQYKAAVDYYAGFGLGKWSDKYSDLKNMRSKSNHWKIYAPVEYYSKKFGLDPQLVYAMIYAESSANPYDATKYSGGGYGLMQCERAAYFNKKQKIEYLDGKVEYFTPSYSNMKPKSCGTKIINGVKVDKAICNQIMFGCNELRKSLKRFKWNIFAALVGYNFGLYGCDLLICRYVAMKNGLSWVNKYGYTVQSSKVQSLYFKELEKGTAAWAGGRKWYVENKHAGTATNIECYLRWYKVVDGQLPYCIDEKGKKRGYGAIKPGTSNKSAEATAVSTESSMTRAASVKNAPTWSISDNTTTKKGVAENVRKKIVNKAREIAELHQKYKKATYYAGACIYDDSKRHRVSGTINGIKNPYCYVCSSLSSCAYLYAGLRSVTAKYGGANCSYGTLVKSACKYSGYTLKKLTSTTINELLPGDLIMLSNATVPSSVTVSWASKSGGSSKYASGGTHHVVVYCGKVNGKRMIAHASAPYKWPRAIRYEDMSITYSSRGSMTHWYTHGIILRPWDLARADKEAKVKNQSATKPTPPKDIVDDPDGTTYEVTFKGLDSAAPKDFVEGGKLITNITVNGVTDKTPYPKTVSHVMLAFGVPSITDNIESVVEDYTSLIKALLKKYPKKPIFVCEECHLTSAYGSDYKNMNTLINDFNTMMLDYCNKTKYVIFLRKPKDMCNTSDKTLWLSSLTSNSWTMKDKASTQTYYKEYKKKILYFGDGADWESNSVTSNKMLDSQRVYTYNKPLTKLQFRVPATSSTNYNDSYYARIIFTTAKGFKLIQPDTVYLEGVDCKNGVLIPKVNTTYIVSVYYNPDTTISDKAYLGSVGAKKKGSNYAQPLFKYASDLVKIANSYYTNNSKFSYNSTTPCDFKNPSENINKWKVNGKYQIDDSCFLNYVLTGWTYDKSPYGNEKKTDNNRNNSVSWAIPSTRNEANIGKYFVQKNWVVDVADLQTFKNLAVGDIIFMDADSKNNGEFMAISHTAIVVEKDKDGDYVALECTNGLSSGVFRKVKVKNLASKNILFVGRFMIG